MRKDARGSVLLIDPYADEREMYATYLRASGFDVWPLDDLAAVCHTLAAKRPDALVLRLGRSRPGLDGLDPLRCARRSRPAGDLAVVVITTSMLSEDEAAARQAGADAYKLLPVGPDEILTELRRLLGSAGRDGTSRTRKRPTAAHRARQLRDCQGSRRSLNVWHEVDLVACAA